MKIKFTVFMLLITLFSINTLRSQTPKKYAVLITGCKPSVGISDNPNPNIIGSPIANHQYDEFWNDTYLMWELLTQKYGFSNENVKVLYYAGNDWINDGLGSSNGRYKASKYFLPYISDFPADTNTIAQVLTDMKNVMTDNDFLFIWTFGHGLKNTATNQGLLRAYNPVSDTAVVTMTDERFGQLVDSIPAAKKVIWMQQCFGGDFSDNISGANTYFLSAGSPGEITHPAEDICPANYKNERYIVGSTIVDTCYHGEFDFHMYSSQNGAAPSGSLYHGHPTSCQNIYFPYANIDSNADSFIDHGESYTWLDTAEYSQETPSIHDPNNLLRYTSFEYPTLLHDNITQSMTCQGLIGISNNTTVKAGDTLTFKANSEIYLLAGSKFVVQQGASIVIEPGVKFKKNFTGPYTIEIQGDMNAFSNVSFDGGTNSQPLKINTRIGSGTYNFDSCTFTNCNYIGTSGIILIDNCVFTRSNCTIYPEQFCSPVLTYIRYNTFEGNNLVTPAISIDGLKKWVIIGNNINQFTEGVKVYRSGRTNSPYLFTNNTITGCTGAGASFYDSRAVVSNNTITGNYIGIISKDLSSLYVHGTCLSINATQTQDLSLNTSSVIEATGIFPIPFNFNKLEFNTTKLNKIRLYDCSISTPYIYNIQKNYWGANANSNTSLIPGQIVIDTANSNITFSYLPVWSPGLDCNTGGGGIPDPNSKAADSLFRIGDEYVQNEDYALAKSIFISLINQYPTTAFAQASLCELFYLESSLGSAYNELKNFYENNPVIVNDTALVKVASFLANKCNIEIKDYSEAIAWFESVIDNPATFNDSIFAIIDLGYTYLLAEADSMKSSPVGRFKEYKPQSHSGFIAYRDYLLSLVNQVTPAKQNFSEYRRALIRAVDPNPANEIILVHYDILSGGEVRLTLVNTLGQQVQAYQTRALGTGTYSESLNIGTVPPGCYFLTISVNGCVSSSYKLIIN